MNPEQEKNLILFPPGSVPWLDQYNRLSKEYIFLNDCCTLNLFESPIHIDMFDNRTEKNIGWVLTRTLERGSSCQVQEVTNFINTLRIQIKERLKNLKDTSQAINQHLDNLWQNLQKVVKDKYGKQMVTQNYGILPYQRGRIYIVAFMQQGISLVDDEELALLVNEMNLERCQEYSK